MYYPDDAEGSSDSHALALLAGAVATPAQACQDNPEIQEAFEMGLRELAEDIVKYHPGLAHLLINMGEAPAPFVHGQN